MDETDCSCAPGTCPEWEAKAGLLRDNPECPYHHESEDAA